MKKLLFALLLLPTFVHAQIITTYVGGSTGAPGDGGPATNANASFVYGLAFDKAGNLYLSNINFNHVRRVDAATGIIERFAGIGVTGAPLGDGGAATNANLNAPCGMACDTAGNLYIADRNNYRVRKVNISTGIITTVAGNGTHHNYGGTGDGGQATAAVFNTVADVKIDKHGDLLIADNSAHRIRKVNMTTGIITHFAGTATISPGHSGDGGAASVAQLNDPRFITLDDNDNIYVAEQLGRYIRKIDAATGIINTVAGTGSFAFNGDTVHALSCNFVPTGIVYHNDAVYFATTDDRVRKLDLSNDTVYTICGNGTELYSGDGGPAIAATLYDPQAMARRGCFELFVADNANLRVRKIELPSVLLTPTITITGPVGAYVGNTVTINATVTGVGAAYNIKWMNCGVEFATTTTPSVTYIKTASTWIDTITARVIPQSTEHICYDSATSAGHLVWTGEGVDGTTKSTFSIYPNPASNILHIAGETIAEVNIVNLLGQTVHSSLHASKAVDVSVALLPKGIYLLKVNGQIAGKLLKE